MSALASSALSVHEQFEELLAGWDGEDARLRYVPASDTWMFVCLHSTRLGPSGGGTRMRVYGDPAEGLADAMRLSAAMTRKLAVAGLPLGGGKAVLAVPSIPHGTDRRRLFLEYAALVDSLGGRFITGPDVNTTECDMDVITNAIRSKQHGGPGSTSPATAVGVLHGIRASLREVFGSDAVEGRMVLVQGVGGVGGRLVELLAEAGADVVVSDVDAARARELVDRLGVRAIAPERALCTRCDVLSPCALGGVLNEQTIPLLRCRIVAGAANNQLATPEDGERLRDAGILYAPDYVINAGGALHGVGLQLLGWTKDELDRHLEQIGETLTTIYRDAALGRMPTSEAADRLASAKLAA